MTISNERIRMHDMLLEMGKEIVQQESPLEPGERSRLWLFDDINHVMQENTASEKVEAIVLNLEDSEGTTLKIEALAQMTNLRVLVLENVNFAGTLTSLSNKLRYVSWHQYPCTCLPSNFESFSLVELIMPYSNVTEIWEGKKVFPNLRNMNFHGSKALIRTPDFGGVPNLERLDLAGCIGLLQLHPSIAKLSKLNFLNLRNCINLAQIPKDMFSLPSLEDLNIIRCPKLNIV